MSAVDEAKNAMEHAGGTAKEAVGKIMGDRSTEEAEGKMAQSKADVKNAGEKLQDAFKH